MKKTQSLSRMTALILMFALLLTGMFPASAFANEDQPFVGKRVLSAEVDGVFYKMEELEAMGITWGEAESEAPQMMSRMAPMAAGDSHYIRQTQVLGVINARSNDSSWGGVVEEFAAFYDASGNSCFCLDPFHSGTFGNRYDN